MFSIVRTQAPHRETLYAPDLSTHYAPELSAANGWIPDWVSDPNVVDADEYAPAFVTSTVFGLYPNLFDVPGYAPELTAEAGWVPDWVPDPFAGHDHSVRTSVDTAIPAQRSRTFGRVGQTLLSRQFCAA